MTNANTTNNQPYKYLNEYYNLRLRKRLIYTVALLTILGNGIRVGVQIYNTGTFDASKSIGTISISLAAIIAILLTAFNRIRVAGSIFGVVGVFGVSAGIYTTNLNNSIPILYIMIIIISGALIAPFAALIFGILSTASYLGVAIYLISNIPGKAPIELGSNVALVGTVLIVSSFVLFLFNNSLSRIAAEGRVQAEELRRTNEQLLLQREAELGTNQQIQDISEQLGIIFEKQNEATEEQVMLVNEVASTTQELDAAARRIANNALTVSTMAEKALKRAEAGQGAALDGVMAITSLRSRVENITQSVRYLNSQIERISEVTDIIGEIADETNLLALNATIEAAGAREYGKRFAAVAEEVQRLSRRTTAAVEQIQEVVSEVIQASNKSLETTEEGMRQAQQGEDLVEQLSAANVEIITLVNQTSELATSIATSTQQQRAASEQIVGNIHRISITSSELADFSLRVSHIIDTLEASTTRLMSSEEEKEEKSTNKELGITDSSDILVQLGLSELD